MLLRVFPPRVDIVISDRSNQFSSVHAAFQLFKATPRKPSGNYIVFIRNVPWTNYPINFCTKLLHKLGRIAEGIDFWSSKVRATAKVGRGRPFGWDTLMHMQVT